MVRPRSRNLWCCLALTLVTTLVITAWAPRPEILPDLGPREPDRVVAASLHGRTGAYLVVGNAASRVDVRLSPLPGLLYRISTPADSGLSPHVTGEEGRLRLTLNETGDSGPDRVQILLNRAVRWDIRMPAGAGEQRLDLSRGSVSRLDLGSSGLVDLTLPRPEGTVPVTLRRGIASVSISTPPGAPVRLRLLGGAGAVTTPWAANNGALTGAVLADPEWHVAGDRYAVYATDGLGSLTLTTRPTH